MIIDHIAVVFLDENIALRFIGRFSFIAFSYLLAYHYRFHTHDQERYKLRLLIFAIISQVPYSLIFGVQLNIFFLLWFGLVMIDTIEMVRMREQVLYPTIITSVALILTYWEGYFIFGLYMIPLFYYLHDNIKIFPFVLLNIMLLNFSIIFAIAAAISLLIIYHIDTDIRINKINKYYFYAFYPVHLIALYKMHELML